MPALNSRQSEWERDGEREKRERRVGEGKRIFGYSRELLQLLTAFN